MAAVAVAPNLHGRVQSRRWTFTLNNPQVLDTQLAHKLMQEERIRYFIFQHEIGENKTEHFQGYLETEHSQRFSYVKNLLPTAHWEVARGSAEQNKSYCSKAETRFPGAEVQEHGEPCAGQGQRTDLEGAWNLLRETNDLLKVIEQKPVAFIRNFRGLTAAWQLSNRPQPRPDVKCFPFYGLSGIGKTHHVMTKVIKDQPYFKLWKKDGQWWDGLLPTHKILWIDEYKGEMPFELFKEVLGPAPLTLPVKGGSTSASFETIWITSNYPPEEWYPSLSPVDLQALRNRITESFHYYGQLEDHLPPDFDRNPRYQEPEDPILSGRAQ